MKKYLLILCIFSTISCKNEKQLFKLYPKEYISQKYKIIQDTLNKEYLNLGEKKWKIISTKSFKNKKHEINSKGNNGLYICVKLDSLFNIVHIIKTIPGWDNQ